MSIRIITSFFILLTLAEQSNGEMPLSCAEIKRRYSCEDKKNYPVHLTFDDGPAERDLTSKVLDALKKNSVKASFFILGDRFDGNEDYDYSRLLQRMKSDGHTIGLHGFHHDHYGQELPQKLFRDLENSEKLMVGSGPKKVPLSSYLSPVMRLPYGDGWLNSRYSGKPNRIRQIQKEISDAGYQHFGWHIDSLDFEQKEAYEKERWLRRPASPSLPRGSNAPLINTLKGICRSGGGVVLMHDIHPVTADNLDYWIKSIKCLGHTFVSSDHFAQDPLLEIHPPEMDSPNCCNSRSEPGIMDKVLNWLFH